jgi:hypothetical protein
MSNEIATPPWLCSGCGYFMDRSAAADASYHAAPGEGDILMCANCGTLHTIRSGERTMMTPEDLASLSPEEREELDLAEQARKATFGRRSLMEKKLNG